jgi:hypothetical protein
MDRSRHPLNVHYGWIADIAVSGSSPILGRWEQGLHAA